MSDTTADHSARVAVLEQIARSTTAALERIDRRLETMELASTRRLELIETAQRSDFRWLLGIMLGGFGMTLTGFAGLLAVLAKGFGWI